MAMGFKPPRLFGGLMPTQQEEEDPYGAMMGRVGAPTMPTGQPPAQEQADRPASFWNGGSKFGVRDGIAGALAVIGDAFAQQGGGQGGSVSMLTQGRTAQLAQAKAAERQAQVLADLQANGMTAEQARLVAGKVGNIGDFKAKTPEEDVFMRRMRAAGIDPASPQGQELLRQKLATESSPAPQMIGDGMGGGRWVNPPAPKLFGAGMPQQAPAAAPAKPAGYGDDWEVVEGPPPSAGGIDNSPEAETMRRLYQQQFGARGDAMFQEWQRNNNRGGR